MGSDCCLSALDGFATLAFGNRRVELVNPVLLQRATAPGNANPEIKTVCRDCFRTFASVYARTTVVCERLSGNCGARLEVHVGEGVVDDVWISLMINYITFGSCSSTSTQEADHLKSFLLRVLPECWEQNRSAGLHARFPPDPSSIMPNLAVLLSGIGTWMASSGRTVPVFVWIPCKWLAVKHADEHRTHVIFQYDATTRALPALFPIMRHGSVTRSRSKISPTGSEQLFAVGKKLYRAANDNLLPWKMEKAELPPLLLLVAHHLRKQELPDDVVHLLPDELAELVLPRPKGLIPFFAKSAFSKKSKSQ
jgi:hypothetical protein